MNLMLILDLNLIVSYALMLTAVNILRCVLMERHRCAITEGIEGQQVVPHIDCVSHMPFIHCVTCMQVALFAFSFQYINMI